MHHRIRWQKGSDPGRRVKISLRMTAVYDTVYIHVYDDTQTMWETNYG